MSNQDSYHKEPIKGRVAIFGGTGQIGSSVAAKLALQGYRVTIISRSIRRVKALSAPGIDHLKINSFDEKDIRSAIKDVDIVINSIGILNEKRHPTQSFEYAHIQLVQSLSNVICELKIKHFIHLSALKASASHAPSRYLKSKGIAENLIKKICSNKVNFTIIQPSLVFSKHAPSIKLFSKMTRLLPGIIPLARASTQFAPIHLSDLTHLITLLIDNPKSFGRTLQAYGDEIHSLKEIIKLIASAHQKHPFIVPLPYYIGWLQAFILNYLIPGKLMTLDNFKSLAIRSIGEQNALTEFEIKPVSFLNWCTYSLR
mgnify:CR=1 FL=1|jgi:uncharacterized protein YbjT (DUF2867 family)